MNVYESWPSGFGSITLRREDPKWKLVKLDIMNTCYLQWFGGTRQWCSVSEWWTPRDLVGACTYQLGRCYTNPCNRDRVSVLSLDSADSGGLTCWWWVFTIGPGRGGCSSAWLHIPALDYICSCAGPLSHRRSTEVRRYQDQNEHCWGAGIIIAITQGVSVSRRAGCLFRVAWRLPGEDVWTFSGWRREPCLQCSKVRTSVNVRDRLTWVLNDLKNPSCNPLTVTRSETLELLPTSLLFHRLLV